MSMDLRMGIRGDPRGWGINSMAGIMMGMYPPAPPRPIDIPTYIIVFQNKTFKKRQYLVYIQTRIITKLTFFFSKHLSKDKTFCIHPHKDHYKVKLQRYLKPHTSISRQEK